jgi:hypothetical protein
MDGEHSDHAGHDDGSPAENCAVARNHPPCWMTPCSPWKVAGACPCLTFHCRAGGNTIMKQTRQQAGCYHDPTARQPRHESMLETKRIHKGHGSPREPRGGSSQGHHGQTQSTSPLLTTDGVDTMYHPLAEIHAIAVQLVVCACWRQTDPTPNLAQARTSQRNSNVTPSTISLAPSPPTISCPRHAMVVEEVAR